MLLFQLILKTTKKLLKSLCHYQAGVLNINGHKILIKGFKVNSIGLKQGVFIEEPEIVSSGYQKG